jgi:hypothetical protein
MKAKSTTIHNAPKKAYATPRLRKIGSIQKLTQKGGSTADIFTNYTA